MIQLIFCYLQKRKKLSLRIESASSLYPLHYACWNSSTEVALYILTQDLEQAKIIVEGAGEFQFLYCGIAGNNFEIVQTLMDKGCELDKQPMNEYIPIQKVIGVQNSDILALLYQKYKKNEISYNQLVIESVINNNEVALEMFYQGKSDIIYSSIEYPFVCLIGLIYNQDYEQKKFKHMLLKILNDAKDMNVEPTNELFDGPAQWACVYLDVDVANLLINNPYFNKDHYFNGKPALQKLVNKIDDSVIPIMKMLFDKGYDLNQTKNNSPTILEFFITAITLNIKAIEFIINNGANMDAPFTKSRKKSKINLSIRHI